MFLFAQKMQGGEVEIADSGVFEGLIAPRRYFGKGDEKDGQPFPVYLALHLAVSPATEINKNGTRAKGLWHSPGLFTSLVDGKLIAEWSYGKYVVEYAKEDGVWKNLKLNWRRIFQTPYEGKGWVEGSISSRYSTKTPPGSRANRPTTYHKVYTPAGAIVFEPAPPEPYDE